MLIEQIRTIEDYTIKLSVVDNESGEQIDFDLTTCTDETKLGAIAKTFGTPESKHYLVVENVQYNDKTVDFTSGKVTCSLFMVMSNGKVYRWSPLVVCPIRRNDKPFAVVLKNTSDVTSFNRRNSFRVPVDMNGTFDWKGYEDEIPCFVLNVSHGGIAVTVKGVENLPSVGEHCKISWNDGTGYEVEATVRRSQPRLGGQYVIGCSLDKEPDSIRSLIQKIQTSRAISADLTEEKKDAGVRRLENWELERDLEKNGLKPGE
ncbi:MAG: PilZ domain-containing protein [Lachnospiraceae bacterium]|nr:PilZ domain-containing protein [Lachnospiraceae bacterium]